MTIRRLSEQVINRIAAGEVIERPASVAKELVENSIDAGATRIDVTIRDGGKSLVAVVDDGCGMTGEELTLAIKRHATSKLVDDNLQLVATLGFRGEALPSIASVSRYTLTSRTADADTAWTLSIDGGELGEAMPAAHPKGTRIEMRDLFYATPARLKFLRTDRTETQRIAETLNRLAMAHPEIAFQLTAEDKIKLAYAAEQSDLLDARLVRLSAVMGREFAENALIIHAERSGTTLTGYAAVPTLNRANGITVFIRQQPASHRQITDRCSARCICGFSRTQSPSSGCSFSRN